MSEDAVLLNSIFLHSSWRAASTYVWEKFRRRSDTYCYFEPLNEYLLALTEETIDRFVPWPYANHPALGAPYLEEYRPLIVSSKVAWNAVPGGASRAGIAGFPAHLTFGRYCAGSDDSLPELENYLGDLAGLALRTGRSPVYGFVRTDLRVGWFRAKMPGTHIFIRREPRRQFMSMLRQAVQGNPYFLQRGVVILRHNMEAPEFAPLLAAIELPALPDSAGLREAFRGRLVDESVLRRLYFIFYFMWLLARRLGDPQCHVVIDVDRLSLDDFYRREIESLLGNLTGMDISFSDCRVERYEENLNWSAAQFEAIEREIENLAGMSLTNFGAASTIGRARVPGSPSCPAVSKECVRYLAGAHSSTVRAADS
jgi:hypothetical protein